MLSTEAAFMLLAMPLCAIVCQRRFTPACFLLLLSETYFDVARHSPVGAAAVYLSMLR